MSVLCLLGALAVGGGVTSSLTGCLTTTTPAGETRPPLLNPRWRNQAFAAHLNFFRDAFREGGSAAVQPVGEYVSAIMREAWLQPAVERRYRLRRAPDRPLGYAGYVGGKHPPVARQAVLVCADLGAGTAKPAADTSAAGPASSNAVEAAALLEVARVYGIASQYTLVPERSVIFALWAHSAEPQDSLEGLRGYLRQPTWRLDAVRAVIYVGLPARLRSDTRALLAEHDIELYAVRAASSVMSSGAARPVSPDSAASGDAPGGERETPASVLRARRLAQRVHERLRAATLTGGKMMPALGDTLRVPKPRQ
jgi:hypothetical protein